MSRLNHCQRVVRSLSRNLFLWTTSTCSFLRFWSHCLSNTWLDAWIIIVRVIWIELTVADLSLIFAECAFMIFLSLLSIVKDSVRCQWIINWMLFAWLLTGITSFILVRVRRQARVSSFVQTLIVLLSSVLLINRWRKTTHHHLVGHIQKRSCSYIVLIVCVLLFDAAPYNRSLVTASTIIRHWWKAALEAFAVTHATVLHDFFDCFGHLSP